ncbi:MAG: NUDIX domain-containing protein [Bacteroidetes bacterium]|nr:NUDIX domain-containing protein [Bacteroidota bacterium]
MAKRFNVRVYGILIKDNKVLVSDEFIKGHHITKFPGGGLEFGEGTKDCLIREFKEELHLDISVLKHYYTTDFFVHSAFDTNSQVISIYYLVDTTQAFTFKTTEKLFDYEKKAGAQSMRWVELKKISDNDFTLIIDKKIGEMLYKDFVK